MREVFYYSLSLFFFDLMNGDGRPFEKKIETVKLFLDNKGQVLNAFLLFYTL